MNIKMENNSSGKKKKGVSWVVDKFLNRLAFGHLSFDAWYHLSGQCMLFSIVFAGVGICKGIMGGRMLGEILPFYIVSFLGMYLYFSLSAMVDIKGKRRILKTNLIDYLENHLSGRIPVTEQDYERLYGPGSPVEEIATRGKAGTRQRTSGRRTVELMPIRSRAVQPEETSDRLDREVFSPENATPEKAEGKAITERPEDPARVTEEELQALLQELLTV